MKPFIRAVNVMILCTAFTIAAGLFVSAESGTLTTQSADDANGGGFCPGVARFDAGSTDIGINKVDIMKDDTFETAGSATPVAAYTAGEQPNAPAALDYKRSTCYSNRADGTVTITQPEDTAGVKYYQLYWADANGPISGYTGLQPIYPTAKKQIIYTLNSDTLIPDGATRLIAYSIGKVPSKDYAETALPAADEKLIFGEKLAEFQVLSDIHITYSKSDDHSKHFAAAMKQITELSPDSIGVITCGDNTDGTSAKKEIEEKQYKNFLDIFSSSGFKSKLYPVLGNHDLYWSATGGRDDAVQMFKEAFGYGDDYDVWMNDNIHLVMLADAGGGDNNATITKDQLVWLDAKLGERYGEEGVLTLLAIHQPLYDTVAGSFKGQGWNGIDANCEDALRAVLAKYPNAIMFNGHTHWEFNSVGIMKKGGTDFMYAFLAPSCGYLWTDDDKYKYGSEGFFVEVYENIVRVRGRDFINELWTSNADFVIVKNTVAESVQAAADTISASTTGEAANENAPASKPSSSAGITAAAICGATVLVTAVAGAAAVISKKRVK